MTDLLLLRPFEFIDYYGEVRDETSYPSSRPAPFEVDRESLGTKGFYVVVEG